MNRVSATIIKEFKQFRRNPFLPKVCIVFPLMVMLVLPLALTMDVNHVGVAVVDHDHGTLGRTLATALHANERLDLTAVTDSYDEALALVEDGRAHVIVEIPRGFGDGTDSQLAVSANAVDSNKGMLGMKYVTALIQQCNLEIASSRHLVISKYRNVEMSKYRNNEITVRYLFNPTLDYRHFMIPALMIMLVVSLCGFLPALNIVSEKETGTIEQINVSPIGQMAFTAGKVIPYWIIGVGVLTIAMLVAWAVYGLAPKAIGAVYLASFLFVVVMSALGVTIANGSSTMQQSMFVMFFFVMVFIMMSGLFTPVSSMPGWAATLAQFIPSSHYVTVMRAAYLRGAVMWTSIGVLAAFAVLLVLLAILTFQKRN